MGKFEQQLNNEMEKRGLIQSKETASAIQGDSQKKPIFSLVAFLKGLLVGALLFGGLVIWAWINAPKTSADLLEKIPSKTTIVDTSFEEPLDVRDVQPVLSMPPVDVPAEDIPPVTTIPNTPPKEEVTESSEETKVESSSLPSPTKNLPAANKAGLIPAPVEGLHQNTAVGVLPVIRAADGLTSFEVYKRPFDKAQTKPKLSIIITDVGLSNSLAENLIANFEAGITLAFSPYADNLKSLMDKAREGGHETWMMLPLETKDYPLTDPGPHALLMNASVERNTERLASVLAGAQGYVGLVAQKNHVFKASDADTKPSIEQIFKRGLAVFDSETTANSFVQELAYKNDYPIAKNNFWLDDDLSPLAFNQKLRQMKEFGEANGSVTLMLRPYPASLKALQKFLNSAAASDFVLAPASAQVKYGEQ